MIESSRPVSVRGVFEVADVFRLREAVDRAEREVAALEPRIGVEHDRTGDRVGDRLEVGDDAILGHREIGLENREDAGAAQALEFGRLPDRLGRGGRRDARDHRHPPGRPLERHLDHPALLRPLQIGELAGRAERCQPVHAGRDQMLAEPPQHLILDPPGRVHRRDQVRKHPVELGAHRWLLETGDLEGIPAPGRRGCDRHARLAISIRLPSGSRV
jgi:hypothetical protein